MSRLCSIVVLGLGLPCLALATAASAAPIAASAPVGLAEPVVAPARATMSRQTVLPKKKRIHANRNVNR